MLEARPREDAKVIKIRSKMGAKMGSRGSYFWTKIGLRERSLPRSDFGAQELDFGDPFGDQNGSKLGPFSDKSSEQKAKGKNEKGERGKKAAWSAPGGSWAPQGGIRPSEWDPRVAPGRVGRG